MLCALCASGVQAGGWAGGAMKLNSLYVEGEDDGSRVYIVTDRFANPDNCSFSDPFYRIYGNTPKGKYITATALSAVTAGKDVALALYGCDDWGRAIVGAIHIIQ